MFKSSNLMKYASIFFLAHMGIMIIASALLAFFNLEGNAGINVAMIMASAMVAGHYFIRDHRRLPSASEKAWLIFLSFLAATLASVLFLGAIALIEPAGIAVIWSSLMEQSSFFLMIMSASALFCILILWMSYGFMLRKQFSSMQKKAECTK